MKMKTLFKKLQSVCNNTASLDLADSRDFNLKFDFFLFKCIFKPTNPSVRLDGIVTDRVWNSEFYFYLNLLGFLDPIY